MVDLLDGGLLKGPRSALSATVALHTHEGMIREGHIVDVIVSPGTASRAFGFVGHVGMVEYRQRSRGFVQMVEVDSFGVDDPTPHTIRYHGRGPAVAPSSALTLDPVELGEVSVGHAPAQPRDDAALMSEMAGVIAATIPAVAVPRPRVPELGDDPVENLRRLFDLTFAELANVFGISERHAHRWQRDGVPAERRSTIDALQAIGLTVIGGLGPVGAKAWLYSGTPTGAQLVQTGRVAELAARAEAEKDSRFT
jgi:hypothetical protein